MVPHERQSSQKVLGGIMIPAKLSTAITIVFGPILDADGAEYTSAVVGDVKICKNNGTPAALNGSATLTHTTAGQYALALTASDISAVGIATIVLDKSTYVAKPVELTVYPAAIYDALIAGTANILGTNPPNDWINAASIAAAALDGKGDWNTVTPPTAAAIRAEIDANSAGITTIITGITTILDGITIILNRLGGFTGSGINTILGFLRAIMRKDAGVPSDVGGTYAASDHSLEAISEAVDAIDVGEGIEVNFTVAASASVLQAIDSGGTIQLRRGDRLAFTILLGTVSGRSGEKLFFTVKRDQVDTEDVDDSLALLQVTELSGAVLVNGQPWLTASDASITVANETTGETTFVVKSDITETLPLGKYAYDVQLIRADGDATTVTRGVLLVVRDITRRRTVA